VWRTFRSERDRNRVDSRWGGCGASSGSTLVLNRVVQFNAGETEKLQLLWPGEPSPGCSASSSNGLAVFASANMRKLAWVLSSCNQSSRWRPALVVASTESASAHSRFCKVWRNFNASLIPGPEGRCT